MKGEHKIQVEFIKKMLRKGCERHSILQEFAKKYKTGVKTFDNRLKIAKDEFKIELDAINERGKAIIEDESEKMALQTLSVAQRIDILTKIATGQLPLLKPNGTGDNLKMIEFVPDWNDRRNAIAELNKMDGAYAAEKIELHNIGEAPVTSLKIRKRSEK